jgi:hypothetical protein
MRATQFEGKQSAAYRVTGVPPNRLDALPVLRLFIEAAGDLA